MISNVLNKEYVTANGIDFNSLSYEYCSDRMLDKDEEDGGQPFSGLAYELTEDGVLIYYGYYKDGFEEGEKVFFYPNGNIESIAYMKRGRSFGEHIEYFEDGKIKSVVNSEYGVVLTKKEWDENATLIYEKKEPTQTDLEIYNANKEWHRKVTGEVEE